MTPVERAHEIAGKLRDSGTPHVVATNPATIQLIFAILMQAFSLLKWWKPEWFINWQVSRLIEKETAGTHLQHRRNALKSEVMAALFDDLSIF